MVPISMVVLFIVGISKCWTISEIGTFIGAVSGPFAGLAGFLYIYASFQIQSKALEFQQLQIIEQKNQFERQSFEAIFFHLLSYFKKSGPVDRLSDIYKEFKNRFYYIDKDHTQGSNGDNIWNTKENSREIKESEALFCAEVGETIELNEKDLRDSLHQLLSILIHLENNQILKNDLRQTLLFNLSGKEIITLYYFYRCTYADYKYEHQLVLYDFFLEINQLDFFDPSHKYWNIKPFDFD